MELENVLYDVQGPLALITINRADKHNAISLATLDDLHSAVDAAAYDDSVRVLAITGAGGKSFASGSDLSEVLHRDFRKALEPIVQGLADKLERTPKPTIAAIDGICMGGGLEVALGCDLRVATPKSRFATPEGKLGIIPGGGACARLPRIVGRGWGMEMMLMGEPIDAERAFQIGLVTRLVESEDLLDPAVAKRIHGDSAQVSGESSGASFRDSRLHFFNRELDLVGTHELDRPIERFECVDIDSDGRLEIIWMAETVRVLEVENLL